MFFLLFIYALIGFLVSMVKINTIIKDTNQSEAKDMFACIISVAILIFTWPYIVYKSTTK